MFGDFFLRILGKMSRIILKRIPAGILRVITGRVPGGIQAKNL